MIDFKEVMHGPYSGVAWLSKRLHWPTVLWVSSWLRCCSSGSHSQELEAIMINKCSKLVVLYFRYEHEGSEDHRGSLSIPP